MEAEDLWTTESEGSGRTIFDWNDVLDEFKSDDDYSTVFTLQSVISIVVPILFGLVVVVGFIGNGLVVVVVTANRQMHTTTNLLIVNLALVDLLFIVFCVPFTAVDYALPSWPFGNVWCKVVQYLVVVTNYASVSTLILMSFDRYLAVTHSSPSKRIRTETNTLLAIVIAWLVVLVVCVPVILTHGEMTYYAGEEYSALCTFLQTGGWSYTTFVINYFLTAYVFPLMLICGLYLSILLRLRRGIAPSIGRVSTESRRDKERVTGRMVGVVVATFVVCWTPIHLILVFKSLNLYENTNVATIIQITSQVLAYANSCMNPILYVFLSDNFRKAFGKIVYCRANNNGDETDTRQPVQTGCTTLK